MGARVFIVSRMPGPNHLTWVCHVIRWTHIKSVIQQTDLANNGLPPDTTHVINVAGQNVLDPTRGWSEGFKQNVRSSRIKTTETLARAIEKAAKPPKSFTTISGVGYYPPSLTAEYTESSPGGSDFFGKLCAEWEAAATLPSSVPTRIVTIRCGPVLARSGGIIKSLYMPFFFGAGGRIASGKQFFPWIHLTDLVRLFLFAAEEDHVTGVLNGVSPQIITNNEFTKALGSAMWRPTLIPMPEFVLIKMFGEERAIMMTQGQKVIPKRPLELGFHYQFQDIKEACSAVIRSLWQLDLSPECS